MNARKDEFEHWMSRVQDYVDGTMSRRDSVHFYLYAQRHPELEAELELYRAISGELDAMPRIEPKDEFDAPILASIPYERYRSAPRGAERVLLLGDTELPLAERLLLSLRRPAAAVAAAYTLFLVIGHSFLAERVEAMASGLGSALAGWVSASQDIPVLSTVVGGAQSLYDASLSAISAVGGLVGAGVLTVVLGLALGVGLWRAASTLRRRQTQSGEQVS